MVFFPFNNSMVRYAEERYLDLELILEDETGLKIPKTAKVEKEFLFGAGGICNRRRQQQRSRCHQEKNAMDLQNL